jgi:hypothetical protein
MTNPRDFLDQFVLPAIEDWRFNAHSIRHVVNVVCELDNLAEHFILHCNSFRLGLLVLRHR